MTRSLIRSDEKHGLAFSHNTYDAHRYSRGKAKIVDCTEHMIDQQHRR